MEEKYHSRDEDDEWIGTNKIDSKYKKAEILILGFFEFFIVKEIIKFIISFYYD